MRTLFVLATILIRRTVALACTEADPVPTARETALDAPVAGSLSFLAESVPTSALECTYKCTMCLPPTKPGVRLQLLLRGEVRVPVHGLRCLPGRIRVERNGVPVHSRCDTFLKHSVGARSRPGAGARGALSR